MVSVGDLNEVVPTGARPRLLVGGGDGLDEHAGGVGGDTECVRERVVAHGGHDRRADRTAELLEPAAHRAAIDARAEPRETIFLAMERQPVAELVGRDVREQRRRGERARDQLTRDLGGRDRGGITGADLVLDARDDEPHVPGAAPHQLVVVLGADALGAALERRIGQLDALLGHIELGQATPARGLRGPLLLAPRRVGRVADVRIGHTAGLEAGEPIELAELGGELELELRGVDALGLGDDKPAAHDLDLELEVTVALAQAITLGDRLVGARALLVGTRLRGICPRALFRERRLELRDPRRERVARRTARVLDHGSALPTRARSVEISRSESTRQCVVARRLAGAGSRSTPSSRSSSTRSSMSSWVVPSGTGGRRNVPASSRL